jgi:hypothetical protein
MSKRPPFPSSAGRPNASDQALERALVALRMQRPDEAERITSDILATPARRTFTAKRC